MLDELSLIIPQFHFLRPLWLLGLLPATLLPIVLFYQHFKMGAWHDLIKPEFQPYLLSGETQKKANFSFYLLGFAWIIVTLALAGPTWQQLPQSVHKKIDARVILIDQSYSMLANDIKPSRNARAIHKLSDLLDTFGEGTTALVAYAGDAHTVTPLTQDTNTIANLAPSLNPLIMPIPGNNLADAIDKAILLFDNSGLTEGKFFLLTDEINEDQIDQINASLENRNITINVLGIGTSEGAPIPLPDGSFLKDSSGAIVLPTLNRAALVKFASQHKGRYSDIKADDSDIEFLTQATLSDQGGNLKETERQFDIWQEQGPWLLLGLMPILALGFRKGWLTQIMLPAIIITSTLQPNVSEASLWQDLWSTGDQQGSEAFKQQDWQNASQQFNDPQWKASSHYRNNDYQKAVEEFAKDTTATGYYNQGNALANAGQLEEAISAYQQSLNLHPENQDAQFNLSLVEKMLEQQESEQDQDGEQQDGENQEQQDSNSENKNQQNSDSSNDQQDQSNEDQQASESDEQDSDKDKDSAGNEATQQEEEQQQADAAKEASPQQESDLDAQEKQKALQQWLGKIPDDPGGLLRQKFLYESKNASSKTQNNGKSW